VHQVGFMYKINCILSALQNLSNIPNARHLVLTETIKVTLVAGHS